jgi:hypothetical protein
MKTILLLLSALLIGLNFNSSAQCSPSTNASITISTTSLLTNSHPTIIKICPTGIVYDTASGVNRSFYLEPGAKLYLKGNPTTLVYMQSGSTLINKGNVSMILLYTEPTTTITNQGNPPANTTTCGTITFPTIPTCAPPNSINENYLFELLSVYPVPAQNQITVSNENNGTLTGVIINAIGQKVKSISFEKGKKTVDVSDLPEGIYFLNLRDKNNTVSTKKLIIAR